MIVRNMKRSSVFIVIMAVVILMAALSGCTSTSSPQAVPVTATPAVTDTPVPVPAVTALPTAAPVQEPDLVAIADKKFADAAEACYAENPVISDITTRLAFTSCMQDVPDPKGVCALSYKGNILKYLKDDDTTAGYSRMNTRIQKARDAYSKDLSYNYLTDQDEACSLQPMGYPI